MAARSGCTPQVGVLQCIPTWLFPTQRQSAIITFYSLGGGSLPGSVPCLHCRRPRWVVVQEYWIDVMGLDWIRTYFGQEED